MACMVLVLPYLLNRVLSQSDYAVWVLGFQASLYVTMFGLGIHQLLNRAIAHHLARGEYEVLNRNLISALVIVASLAASAFMFVLISAQFVTQITHAQAEHNAVIEQVWRKTGGAASLGLFALFFFGCFGGQQRYEWENVYKAIISIGFIALVLSAIGLGQIITPDVLASLYFVAVIAGLFFLSWRFVAQTQLCIPSLKDWHLPTAKSYLRGMYGLSVWQIGVLMVSGFDLWIVAKVDFAAVPGYAIALSFLLFVSGSVSAMVGPCLPRFATELGKANYGQFVQIFVAYQAKLLLLLGSLCIVLISLPSQWWTDLLMESAPSFNQVFPILLLATCLRLITVLYSIAVIAANVQHRIIISPLVEGVINLVSSILLAYWFGAIGVAIGTLLGSAACVLFAAFYNISRTVSAVPITALKMMYPWKN
jgi:O-antigen/teichoic acid export membrane protein